MRTLRVAFVLVTIGATPLHADDGYELWLRYRRVGDAALLAEYRTAFTGGVVEGRSPTIAVARAELLAGLRGLVDSAIAVTALPTQRSAIVAGTRESSGRVAALVTKGELTAAGTEGFLIRDAVLRNRRVFVIAANSDVGVLHGVFAFLRALQTHRSIGALAVVSAPTIQRRLLDHWDNIDRTVERGYAGPSIWEWDKLPHVVSPRYRDYARANASVGINGAVLTNVNANAKFLTAEYLTKAASIADVLRPYGITVYLTARFSAPIELGGLPSADPLDPGVRAWWRAKVDEIYRAIPDFGGFVIKANSEGQPGPQDYGRTHADGANLFADALAPHRGIVMWRAFVYSNQVAADRVMQAYNEFTPLDGQFRDNVLVQVKSGPLDFQPREPFHPLVGAMRRTPLMLEFQITKEYLGQDSHLVYLAPLFKEALDADTYASGAGSTVARVVDGSLRHARLTGIAGVANVGSDRNWTGSQFNQANWFAFGRLAWDHDLSPSQIADDWVRMTFSNDAVVVRNVTHMMLVSREAVVNYMTPLGLAHIMATGHHYGPGPWVKLARADQSPVYFHQADSAGLGFDRTPTGSNAVAQYAPPVRDRFASRATVPDSLLLWFHHVGWNERLRSGRTLWDDLALHYQAGVDTVRSMQRVWDGLAGQIDDERFTEVRSMLSIQEREARWWRDAVLQYFQSFSHMPLPAGVERPAHPLSYYVALRCPRDRNRRRCDGT